MSQKQMREDLMAFLATSADPSLSKVYATLAPRNSSPPFVVYHVVGHSPTYVQGAAAAGHETRIQFDIHTETPTQAELLADELANKLSGAHNFTQGGTHFGAIFKEGTEFDDHSAESATDSTPGHHRKILDYSIHWQTAASLN